MIKQATVDQVRKLEIPREKTFIVAAMRRYPRGIRKEWIDAYNSALAPDIRLHTDAQKAFRKSPHDSAFQKVRYEDRFRLSTRALFDLKYYANMSAKKDVYFICQCELGERCHRELLMMIARDKFGAKVGKIHNAYPEFAKRLNLGFISLDQTPSYNSSIMD